ncbi:aminotransferase class I/II-fold pyridoxal phosphate-dependent enzyme [bacterium]|nr:aminotransferase class I/II-fold pyridoxal phosphate-dependent enzyme [bacterium]
MAIDLRSDTVTKPSPAMRQAIATAEVGDDVFLEDPTVIRLEEHTAELLGTEAALFVPSGHMANQLGLRVLGRAGDSVIAHASSHIFEYESGAPSAVSGLAPRFIDTPDGTFAAADVADLLQPRNIHHSRNRIVVIENTHNRCGGVVWPQDQYENVCVFCRDHELSVHLDGARLWNVCAATGTPPSRWASQVESVTVCFSKGLGAPVGSALAGSRAFIDDARFFRKMLGGQMRQVGIIAAGALYALEHNRERLVEDHANAQLFTKLVNEAPGLSCIWPDTNIVVIDVLDHTILAQQIVDDLIAEGVLVLSMGERKIRAVTHLDVSADQCRQAGEIVQRVMQQLVN